MDTLVHVFRSPDPKGHVRCCHHLALVVIPKRLHLNLLWKHRAIACHLQSLSFFLLIGNTSQKRGPKAPKKGVYSSSPTYNATPSAKKQWPYKMSGLSWEEQFSSISISVSESGSDKRSDLWWEGPYKRGTTV